MRVWFTLLALACFVPQQFHCCVQSCGPCIEPHDESHAKRSSCGHDHRPQNPDSPSVPQDHSSHHLCVATHLFYLARTDADSPLPDLSGIDAVLPLPETVVDRQRGDPRVVLASHSVPPLRVGQIRALHGVWLI